MNNKTVFTSNIICPLKTVQMVFNIFSIRKKEPYITRFILILILELILKLKKIKLSYNSLNRVVIIFNKNIEIWFFPGYWAILYLNFIL